MWYPIQLNARLHNNYITCPFAQVQQSPSQGPLNVMKEMEMKGNRGAGGKPVYIFGGFPVQKSVSVCPRCSSILSTFFWGLKQPLILETALDKRIPDAVVLGGSDPGSSSLEALNAAVDGVNVDTQRDWGLVAK